MDTQSVGKNLVYQRKLKGYSQEELSQKTQVTIRTIQRIEKGDVNPHLQTIKLLAVALDIEMDDLLLLENPKEENIQQKWLLLLHGTPLLGLVLPLCNILFPLFLWIHKREDNRLYNDHGIKVVNFQISMTVLYVISFIGLLTVEGYGFLFFITIIPFSIGVTLFNIFRAINSYTCFYPLAFPFLKNNQKNRKSSPLLLFVVGIILFSNMANAQSSHIQRLDGSQITKDSLTSKIEQLVKDAHVHGLAVSVFEDNKISTQNTFGYKNYSGKLKLSGNTNMYGASLSKAVFGVLVLKLVENGIIDLDTSLESYLPKRIYEYQPLTKWHDNFSELKNDSLYHKITARMCLNHTSGFPNWRWFEADKLLKVKFEPGTKYLYSGEGMVYLQVVIEKLTGKNLEQLAQEIIFQPLNMDNTSYKWQEEYGEDFAFGHNTKGELYQKDMDNEPRSASTLETTPNDYALFMEAVLQDKILNKSSYRELFKPQIRIRSLTQFPPGSEILSATNDAIELSYGLGWGVFKTPYGKGVFKEGHGDGFQHYTILFPKAKKGIMLMSNSDNGESIFKEVLEVALMDVYTPWEWENYIPYNLDSK
ncbi:serine hydrolase [Flavobacteriaceae bacterium KMM 6898]|nr:serine hydrolase [Flavobacteriaceae bacterium KMM 6898]